MEWEIRVYPNLKDEDLTGNFDDLCSEIDDILFSAVMSIADKFTDMGIMGPGKDVPIVLIDIHGNHSFPIVASVRDS